MRSAQGNMLAPEARRSSANNSHECNAKTMEGRGAGDIFHNFVYNIPKINKNNLKKNETKNENSDALAEK